MKFERPSFLPTSISSDKYNKWIQRKARAHAIRDSERFGKEISITDYSNLIHEAVQRSKGNDEYTGDRLHWHKISTYRNDLANDKKGKHKYLRSFNKMPTVDHEFIGKNRFNFVICAWVVNASKSRLTYPELVELCKDIIRHNKKKK